MVVFWKLPGEFHVQHGLKNTGLKSNSKAYLKWLSKRFPYRTVNLNRKEGWQLACLRGEWNDTLNKENKKGVFALALAGGLGVEGEGREREGCVCSSQPLSLAPS